MHYYQHNIAEYRADTAHLSMLEHGAYRQLLHWYYLDEKPIPIEINTVFRRLCARTEEEQEAVKIVLAEFFSRTESGYFHARCDREISAYAAKLDSHRSRGKLGGRPKVSKDIVVEKHTEATSLTPEISNAEPEADMFGEPVKRAVESVNPKFNPQDYLLSLGVPESVASDWLAHRKTMKAAPTETAINSIAKQAEKAGIPLGEALAECCQRGWRGFKAEWMSESRGQQSSSGSYHDMMTNAYATMYGTNRG